MVKCSFCGTEITRGTGLMYVKKDGKIFNFCARKCEVNSQKLGRNMRKVRWTTEFHRLKAAGDKTQ